MRYPGFIGPSYQSQSYTFDQEDTINFYLAPTEGAGTQGQMALFPTPGVATIGTAGGGTGRAHFAENGREWAVTGELFLEISSTGLRTTRGTVASNSNPATISSNGDAGNELFITSGGNGYIYNIATDTFSTIAALAGIADQGDQLDGFFLALDQATSTVYISELNQGTTWDPTQSFQRSAASDPWVAMKVTSPYIWLFGTHTSEVWFNAGAAPLPFEKHPSGSLPYGCAAAFTPSVAQGSLCWLGRSAIGEGMVFVAQGFSPERVSTFPIQHAIQGYGNIADAIGDSYEDSGHTFYLLSIPDAPVTWCFDLTVGQWHKRGTWISESATYQNWRPRFHVFVFGEHRWLDFETGDVYRSDASLQFDVDGREIRRLRRAPALVHENERIFYSAFELFMDVGVGNAVSPGDDPQVMLRWSDDGGKTWSNENWRSAGKIGEYRTRVRWTRLGQARRRVFEVVMSDPVPWRLVDAYLESRQPPGRLSQVQAAQWAG